MERINLKSNKVAYYTIVISLIFLCMIGSIFMGSTLFFIVKIPITKLNFIIFPIITILLVKVLFKKDEEKISWTFLILLLISFFLISAILAIVCNYIWDNSYDSLWYHQEGVIRLVKGWNTFYDPQVSNLNIWVEHYSKAPWIFAATICKITGHIECGKILSILLPIISGILGFGVFYLITKGRKILSFIGAVILVLNPVSIGQMFTYYVDSQQGCYIIFLLMILYIIIFTKGFNKFKYFSLFNIVIFLCNIKFTGLAYSIGILGVYFIYVLISSNKNNKIKVFKFLLLSCIITVGITGFNPYITNTINKGNPLYPLAGEGKIDIMTDNTPSNFRYDTQFGKLVKSLIGYPVKENIDGYNLSLNNIIKVNKEVLNYYSTTDARIRGFGVYSIIFLPLTIILMIVLILISKNNKVKLLSILVIVALTGVTLFGGEFWWARYIAYIWIFPVFIALLSCINKKRIFKIIGYSMIILIFINSIIILPEAIKDKVQNGVGARKYFLNRPIPIEIYNDNFKYSVINKAEEYGIDYILKEIQ